MRPDRQPADGTEPEGLPRHLIVETDALSRAPMWRREPYLLFFPLGILLSWAGVGHWFLHSLGLLADYRPIFHSLAQIQGFLTCFAVGFLFTMIPRRTGSAPPARWEMGIGLVAPVLTTLSAWQGRWVVSQISWLLLAVTLIAFAVRRFVSGTSRRRPPNAFVWIPLSLVMGMAGSILTLFSGAPGEMSWLHELGRGLLLHGMFTGLVLGVGSLALPLMTRGDAPPDAGSTARDLEERLLHGAGALLLVASLWMEVRLSFQWAMLLRGTVVLVALLGGAQLWRRPRPAWNARSIWVAAWLVPLGSFLAAAFPMEFRAGFHVTFVGGFALLVLAVSTQVTLGHGGFEKLMFGKPWQVLVMAGAILLAATGRALMELDPTRYFRWMAVASSLFFLATAVWLGFLLPKILPRLKNGDSDGIR